MNQLLKNTCIFMALLSLAGCGKTTYKQAVEKSQPELERRGKFAALGPEFVRFPTFPIAFRVPKMFLEDDIVSQRWTSGNGQAVKLNSKDPIELKANADARGPIRPDVAIPLELQDALLNQAHQGTYLCEYKVTVLSDPTNPGSGTESKQSFMMSIWMFDTSPQSRIKPPNDLALLSGVKLRGKVDQTRLEIAKAQGKAPEKSPVWEEDIIDVMATPENLSPAPITAKLARLPVTSKFMVGSGFNRIPVEMKGHLRLWSFRLDKYQVLLALRASDALASGEAPEFPQDPENPSSDRLLDIGRAVIGSMAIVADAAPESEEKKK